MHLPTLKILRGFTRNKNIILISPIVIASAIQAHVTFANVSANPGASMMQAMTVPSNSRKA